MDNQQLKTLITRQPFRPFDPMSYDHWKTTEPYWADWTEIESGQEHDEELLRTERARLLALQLERARREPPQEIDDQLPF